MTDEEIRAAALQFVRKLSGFNAPSSANEAAFHKAVDEVAGVSATLLASLATHAPPHNREAEPVPSGSTADWRVAGEESRASRARDAACKAEAARRFCA